MGGRERYTAAYLLHGDEPTLVETGPATSVAPVTRALDAPRVGPEALAHIVLTHIHLDHAGGVGALARRFPRATVWVHERGARHLADPTRLVASATRVYGEERMASLFGPVEAVPAERIRILADGAIIGMSAAVRSSRSTRPGTHRTTWPSSTHPRASSSRAMRSGIHVPDLPVLRPATPPPEFDLDARDRQHRTRSAQAAGSTLLFAHFGPIADVDRTCELAVRRLREWIERRSRRDAFDRRPGRDRRGALARGGRETVTGAEASSTSTASRRSRASG